MPRSHETRSGERFPLKPRNIRVPNPIQSYQTNLLSLINFDFPDRLHVPRQSKKLGICERLRIKPNSPESWEAKRLKLLLHKRGPGYIIMYFMYSCMWYSSMSNLGLRQWWVFHWIELVRFSSGMSAMLRTGSINYAQAALRAADYAKDQAWSTVFRKVERDKAFGCGSVCTADQVADQEVYRCFEFSFKIFCLDSYSLNWPRPTRMQLIWQPRPLLRPRLWRRNRVETCCVLKCCAWAEQQWITMRCCLPGPIFRNLMISKYPASSILFDQKRWPIVLGAAVYSEIHARLLVPTKCSCPSEPHRHNRMWSNSGPRPIWKVSLRRFKADLTVSTPLKSASGAIVGSVVRGKGLHIRTCNCTRPVIMSNVGSVECVEFLALPWSCGTALLVSRQREASEGLMTQWSRRAQFHRRGQSDSSYSTWSAWTHHDKTHGSPWALGFEIFQRSACPCNARFSQFTVDLRKQS